MTRTLTIVTAIALLIFNGAAAQTEDALTKNKNFKGAVATLGSYKAIYQLDTSDPKVVEKAFHNIENVLLDPRLKGKIEVELVTFSSGTEVVLKKGPHAEELKKLVGMGVIIAQCGNSLTVRKLTPDDLLDFIAVVPSANGELIIRQVEGWAVVKP